jgi:ribonuclease P protein component
LRLKSSLIIKELFRHNFFLSAGSFRLFCSEADLPVGKGLQIMISAPKKNFSKASDRNRVKRLIREALRLQIHEVEDFIRQQNKSLAISIMYQGRAVPTFLVTFNHIQQLLVRLRQHYEIPSESPVQPVDTHHQSISDHDISDSGAQ